MMTGEQYRGSLRDGRRIYIEGKRVTDVPGEHLFKPGVDWCAAGYDRYYDPTPGAAGPYFFVPRSVDELKGQEERQKKWDLPTISTSQGLLMVLTAASRMKADHPVYAERALAYFDDAKRRDIRLVQCITDAKGDRSLPPAKQDDPDLYLRIVARESDGVVIRGAKLHISSCAIAHEMIVMPTKRMKPGEEDWSFAGIVPVNAPGVKVVNTTFAPSPGDPERFPWSSRFAIPEGFVIFDDVFVPNERVFLAGEVAHSGTWAHTLGLWERIGSLGHYVDIADTLVGLAQLIAEANGLARIPHIREKIGDMVTYATMIKASLEAAISNADFTVEGYATPNELFTNAGKFYASAEFSLIVRHLHDIAGGAVLTAPSMLDLRNPQIGKFVAKYMRTMEGVDAEYRMRLFHTIRDYTADAYGGWQHVTMLQAGGGLFAQRLVATKHYDFEHAKQLARDAAGLTAPEPAAALAD